jgi:hypothetical protein
MRQAVKSDSALTCWDSDILLKLLEDVHAIRRRLQLRKLSYGCADAVCVRDLVLVSDIYLWRPVPARFEHARHACCG